MSEPADTLQNIDARTQDIEQNVQELLAQLQAVDSLAAPDRGNSLDRMGKGAVYYNPETGKGYGPGHFLPHGLLDQLVGNSVERVDLPTDQIESMQSSSTGGLHGQDDLLSQPLVLPPPSLEAPLPTVMSMPPTTVDAPVVSESPPPIAEMLQQSQAIMSKDTATPPPWEPQGPPPVSEQAELAAMQKLESLPSPLLPESQQDFSSDDSLRQEPFDAAPQMTLPPSLPNMDASITNAPGGESSSMFDNKAIFAEATDKIDELIEAITKLTEAYRRDGAGDRSSVPEGDRGPIILPKRDAEMENVIKFEMADRENMLQWSRSRDAH